MNYADRIAREASANRRMDVRAALRDRPCVRGVCVETIESVPWSRHYSSRCWRHDPARTERLAFRLERLRIRADNRAAARDRYLGEPVLLTRGEHGYAREVLATVIEVGEVTARIRIGESHEIWVAASRLRHAIPMQPLRSSYRIDEDDYAPPAPKPQRKAPRRPSAAQLARRADKAAEDKRRRDDYAQRFRRAT